MMNFQMLTVSSSVPVRQRAFTWASPLVSGPHRRKKIYLTAGSMLHSSTLKRDFRSIFTATLFFFPQITAPDQNWCGCRFSTISPGGYEWGYEAAKLIVAFNLCEGTAVGARNDDREVPKDVVQWGRIKEILPIATREGIRGLCFSAVINLGDEHLNAGGGKGDSM